MRFTGGGRQIDIMSKTTQEDIACGDCDYTISQGEFDSGKGRIMFNDVNEEGTEYRCGCCDDRVADPMGMFPDDEEDICSTCGKDYEECETCECPNDAKCLMLCKIEKEETQKRRKFMEVMATPVVGDNLTAEERRIKIKELGLTAEELYKKWILEWS